MGGEAGERPATRGRSGVGENREVFARKIMLTGGASGRKADKLCGLIREAGRRELSIGVVRSCGAEYARIRDTGAEGVDTESRGGLRARVSYAGGAVSRMGDRLDRWGMERDRRVNRIRAK